MSVVKAVTVMKRILRQYLHLNCKRILRIPTTFSLAYKKILWENRHEKWKIERKLFESKKSRKTKMISTSILFGKSLIKILWDFIFYGWKEFIESFVHIFSYSFSFKSLRMVISAVWAYSLEVTEGMYQICAEYWNRQTIYHSKSIINISVSTDKVLKFNWKYTAYKQKLRATFIYYWFQFQFSYFQLLFNFLSMWKYP